MMLEDNWAGSAARRAVFWCCFLTFAANTSIEFAFKLASYKSRTCLLVEFSEFIAERGCDLVHETEGQVVVHP
jgi:hypothetical protein